MPPFISHKNLFLANAGECSQQFELESQHYKIQKREDYVLNPPVYVTMAKGEERFRQFRKYVENEFWTLHVFQMEFVKLAYQVLAEAIVGPEDWSQVGPMLAEEYGMYFFT